MIEPTDDMRAAIREVHSGCDCDTCLNEMATAVLAIVERERCLEAKGHVYHPLRRTPTDESHPPEIRWKP